MPVHPASEKQELFRATPESLIRRKASENRAETPDGGANSQIKITLATQDNPICPLSSLLMPLNSTPEDNLSLSAKKRLCF